MTCSLCPKVALYMAGKTYYCRDHRAEAVTRSTEIGQETQSRKSAESYHYDACIAKSRLHHS
jgi:hypothetical protein